MIVCQCTGVTDTTIERLIEAGASTVADITRRCGAGRCCTPCREEIAAMLACRPEARSFEPEPTAAAAL